MKATAESRARLLLLLALAATLVVTLLFPLGELFVRSLHRMEPVADATGHIITGEHYVGAANYRDYFAHPRLRQSLLNTLWVSGLTTLFAVTLAFLQAYGLTHARVPGRGFHRLAALLPLFAPTMLYGLSLVYLFGRQGLVTTGFFGALPGWNIDLYGPVGIVIAETVYTFPIAFLILLVGLRSIDGRLYEAARTLGASAGRTFLTVTLPAVRLPLAAAVSAVFLHAFTDFGAPKIVGGNFNVLAVDIYQQVVGQQNFNLGAVASLLMLGPAALAFAADRLLARRAGAALTARSVLHQPRPRPAVDAAFGVACAVITLALLVVTLTGVAAALFDSWPYRLELTLRHFDFTETAGRGPNPLGISLQLALGTALVGTPLAFLAAYLVERGRGQLALRGAVQLLATLPLALPGLVIGIAYIFFFNRPTLRLPGLELANPWGGTVGSLGLLIAATVVHFLAVSYLTAASAIRQLDREFEACAESLGVPFWTTLRRVTLPVCLPALLEIAGYFFVSAMSTISAVIFLYAPETRPAAVAVVNMDDAGDQAAAAALCALILLVNVGAKLLVEGASHLLTGRTQRWRRA